MLSLLIKTEHSFLGQPLLVEKKKVVITCGPFFVFPDDEKHEAKQVGQERRKLKALSLLTVSWCYCCGNSHEMKLRVLWEFHFYSGCKSCSALWEDVWDT